MKHKTTLNHQDYNTSKPIYSMGIMNYCSHDPGCTLIRLQNNKLDFISSEEGFLSRKKKSYQFPIRSMKYCLDYFNIKIDNLDVLMLDFMDNKRSFKTSNNYRLLIGDYLRSRLKINSEKIKFIKSHHYAHALTAFWPSPFSEAAVMVVDGLGSLQQTTSIFSFNRNGKKRLIFEQLGNGIGELYSLITKKLSFESGEEGKTMGLAPYGRKVKSKIVKNDFLKGSYSDCLIDYSSIIDRHPSPNLKIDIKTPRQKGEVYNDYYTKLAFELQKETENCLTHLSKKALELCKTKNLCFAGGVALNCVANNKIQELKELDGFWVQPASGDSGIPFGLALAGLEELGINLYEIMSSENRNKLSIPYSNDIEPFDKELNLSIKKILKDNKVKSSKLNIEKIAQHLLDKKVIALFHKGIEFGPRALGHRSFLADARAVEMKEIMNSKIKHREGYRPFAPIVLKNDFNKYFISKTNEHPFMLQAPLCNKLALEKVPAVCHVDQTARVQTVTKENGIAYDILLKYKELCGVSVLINTSFNDNDEPIVFTKLDAICAFLNCNADILILDNIVINRKDIPNVKLLLNSSEMLQKNNRDKYFESAISELTTISNPRKAKSLISFLKINSKLSKIFREDRVFDKLIQFILNRNKNKFLVLDDFHMKILNKFSNIFAIKSKDYYPKLKIVNDNLNGLNDIEANSDFILYNMSANYHNKFTKHLFNSHETLFCFYEMEDKKISEKFLESYESPEQTSDIFDTYEHKTNLTIKDFFDNIS